VFRTALFTIVLSLAVGHSAGLFCKAWCHDVAPARCAHESSTTSASVSADDRCQDAADSAVAFVREDGRRAAADPGAHNALVVHRFRPDSLPRALPFGFEPGRRLLEERPPLTSLRI
jgi:hypothetical protein